MNLDKLKKELKQKSNKEKSMGLQRFFKTGKGEYGEGDIFIGIVVPELRKTAKTFFKELDLEEIKTLLYSKIHEERMISLFILVMKFEKSNEEDKKVYYQFYINNTNQINNWDLVDLSAYRIMGEYLFDKSDRKILYKLVKSKNLWERRISILTTFHFIKNKSYDDSLELAKILLQDKHDLIHKAVGWMLREIGKRDLVVEENFLKEHYKKMPRTMLRYAIEKFPETKRQKYLKSEI